jgi:hypothetical protein
VSAKETVRKEQHLFDNHILGALPSDVHRASYLSHRCVGTGRAFTWSGGGFVFDWLMQPDVFVTAVRDRCHLHLASLVDPATRLPLPCDCVAYVNPADPVLECLNHARLCARNGDVRTHRHTAIVEALFKALKCNSVGAAVVRGKEYARRADQPAPPADVVAAAAAGGGGVDVAAGAVAGVVVAAAAAAAADDAAAGAVDAAGAAAAAAAAALAAVRVAIAAPAPPYAAVAAAGAGAAAGAAAAAAADDAAAGAVDDAGAAAAAAPAAAPVAAAAPAPAADAAAAPAAAAPAADDIDDDNVPLPDDGAPRAALARTDLELVRRDGSTARIDVRVVDPTASHVRRHWRSATVPGGAAEGAARKKRRHYSQFALPVGQGQELVPFVIETSGRLGKDAAQFLDSVFPAGSRNVAAKQRFFATLTLTLARFNYKMVEATAQRRLDGEH